MDRTTKVLKVLGKVINIVMIFINGLDLLGPDQQVQRLGLMFKEWEKKVGNDTYYNDFLSLIEADEYLQQLLDTHEVYFPALESDLEGYLTGERDLTPAQMRLPKEEREKVQRVPNVSEECAAALLGYFGQIGAESSQ